MHLIAEVIIQKKFPASSGIFDYIVPEDMTLSVGDAVEVPLRRQRVHGVICALKHESAFKNLQSILSIVQSNALSPDDLARITHIAQITQQSPASFLTLVPLVPLVVQQRDAMNGVSTTPQSKSTSRSTSNNHISPTLSRNEHQELLTAFSTITTPHTQFTCTALAHSSDVQCALAYALAKHHAKDLHGQLLILVPHERDAQALARLLTDIPFSLVTGTTLQKERTRIAHAWHTGNTPLLITTKQGALWSASSLTRVLVLASGSTEYAQQRQSPRFDPREAAKTLAQMHHAHYVSIDALPRLEDISCRVACAAPVPAIISLKHQEEKTANPLLSATLLAEITRASQSGKKSLLFFNRKGAAKRLQCSACGETPLCGTCGNIPLVRVNDLVCPVCTSEMWVPEACPWCGKKKLVFRGIGGEKIADALQNIFPTLRITHAEKGQDTDWHTGDIILATEHFFTSILTPFTTYHFGLVADVLGEMPLYAPHFRAGEYAARNIARLGFLAQKEHASFFVQTFVPDRIQELLDQEHFVREELRLRKNYSLPPFGNITHPLFDGSYGTPPRSS